MELISLGFRISLIGVFNVFVFKTKDKCYKIETIEKNKKKKIRAYTFFEKFKKEELSYAEEKELKKLLNRYKQQGKISTREISKEDVLYIFQTEKSYHTVLEEVEFVDVEDTRKEGEWFYYEVNNLLSVVDSNYFQYSDSNEIVIDEDMSTTLGDRRLLNYKVEVEVYGEHKNDGQFVEYSFTFISPKGVKTFINTEMCLMVGWNYSDSVIFG